MFDNTLNRSVQLPVRRIAGLQLFLWWTLATWAPTAVCVLPILLISRMSDSSYNGDNGLGPIGLCGLDMLAMGVLVGTTQAVALGQILHGLRRGQWVQATALGIVLALAALLQLNSQSVPLVGAAVVAGGIFGVAQWGALRQHLPGSQWWIVANAVGWTLIMALVRWATPSNLPIGPVVINWFPFRPVEAIPYWGIAFAAGIALYALLTGLVLVVLTRRAASS